MSRPAAGGSRRLFLALGSIGAAALLVRRDGRRAPAHPDLEGSELRQAARRAELCSAANAAGVGLRGEYFTAERCAGAPLLVRLDGTIDFDTSLDWPAEYHDRPPRSVRWSGWVKPTLSGHYRFHAGAGDARIVVARQPLAGPDAPPGGASLELAAGRFYPIRIDLEHIAHDTAEQRIRLEWTAPHGARFLVPRALLYLPAEGLAPPAT